MSNCRWGFNGLYVTVIMKLCAELDTVVLTVKYIVYPIASYDNDISFNHALDAGTSCAGFSGRDYFLNFGAPEAHIGKRISSAEVEP
jgi:hypothetical protein